MTVYEFAQKLLTSKNPNAPVVLYHIDDEYGYQTFDVGMMDESIVDFNIELI